MAVSLVGIQMTMPRDARLMVIVVCTGDWNLTVYELGLSGSIQAEIGPSSAVWHRSSAK
jgi:hypothetical protein